MSTDLTVPQKVDKLKLAMTSPGIESQFKAALGGDTGAFTASVIELFANDQYLQNCDPNAVLMQALKAALLRLPVIKSLGYAYIIAYNGKPEFVIGYKGLVQLAIRSGYYKHLNFDSVYAGEYRTTNKLTGEFDLGGTKTSDEVIGYFAHFELLNGFSKTIYMTKEKVIAHAKEHSKSYGRQGSAWQTDFDAMAMKTPLRLLLSKYGQLSIEMQQALTQDDDDIANGLQNKIANHGNATPKDFTAATVVSTSMGQQPGEEIKDFGNNNTRRQF